MLIQINENISIKLTISKDFTVKNCFGVELKDLIICKINLYKIQIVASLSN